MKEADSEAEVQVSLLPCLAVWVKVHAQKSLYTVFLYVGSLQIMCDAGHFFTRLPPLSLSIKTVCFT